MATAPQPFILYKAVLTSEIDEICKKNYLKLDPGLMYIGLRQSIQEALNRVEMVGDQCSKQTHVILEVEFSPLGVAYFTTTYGDQSYGHLPVLKKIWNGSHRDKGVWHFTNKLPLSLHDMQNNQLVKTKWMEIVWVVISRPSVTERSMDSHSRTFYINSYR